MSVVISGVGLWVGEVPGPHASLNASSPAPTRSEIVARCLADALGSARLGPLGVDDFVVNVAQLSHSRVGGSGLRDFHGPDPRTFLSGVVPWVTLTHACASVLFAMRLAGILLSQGRYARVVVTGALTPTVYDGEGMRALGTLGRERARPFAVDRDGTVLGVGGGALVLEHADLVRERGLRPVARVLGVDTRVVSEPRAGSDATAIERCILGALGQAGTTHVDSVEAHATGTVVGDQAELAALESVASRFGWQGVPVSSTKALTGHLLQAAGLPSVVAACHALRDGANVDATAAEQSVGALRTSPALRLGGNGTPAPTQPTALVNAFGFSGNYAAAVLSLDRTDEHPDAPLPLVERTPW